MEHVLVQIRKAAGGGQHCDCTDVVIAGDIFDVFNPAPELISFALRLLPPNCYAVPGQHDLPFHRYDERHRSGYGVLEEAGAIINLDQPVLLRDDKIVLHGFPWGRPLGGADENSGWAQVAVIHHLVWQQGAGYPGAPQDSHAAAVIERMPNFDLIVAGDQHVGFKRDHLVNCGSPMRRTRADAAREPCVWLLHDTGFVERVAIDDPADWYAGEDAALHAAVDPGQFVRAVKALQAGEADFASAVREACRGEPDAVRGYVEEVVQSVSKKEVR